MQTADLGYLDYRTAIDRVNFPSLGAVHLQRLVNAEFMVVAEVRPKDATQVHAVEHDKVDETLAADGADQPFDETLAASILSASAGNIDGATFALASQWLDALAQYVTVVETQIGMTWDNTNASGYAMEKYGKTLADSDNPALVAYIQSAVLGNLQF